MAYVFTPQTVDPEFAGRVLEHVSKGLGPLLREKRPDDRYELEADQDSPSSSYRVVDASIDVDALLRRTWRQIAEGEGYDSFETFCEERIGEPVDPDEIVDPEIAAQYTPRTDFPDGRAYEVLEPWLERVGPRGRVPGHEVALGMGGGSFFEELFKAAMDKRPPEEREDAYPLGWVIAHDGPMPGSDYLGIEVSGPVGLSCLQHVLDRAGAGIHLTFAPESFPGITRCP